MDYLANVIPRLGQTVGRFQLLEELGRGGFGVVFRATQVGLGIDVAVKVMVPHLTASDEREQWLGRFEQEALILKRLHHPATIRILDHGRTEAGLPFFALEFVRGRPLGRVIADRPLTVGQVARIVDQVLGSLEEAHSVGVVHRDLKPDNIMVLDVTGANDAVKVLDFGIAKLAGDDAAVQTQTGLAVGTPRYMAPEQFEDFKHTDGRVDLYALGLIMAECLTGQPVVSATSQGAQISAQVRPDPHQFSPYLQQLALFPVIARATNKRPDYRFASAPEMRQAVLDATSEASDRTALASSPGVPARPQAVALAPPAPTPGPQPLARTGVSPALVIGAVAAVVVVLAVVLAVVLLGGDGESDEAATAGPNQTDSEEQAEPVAPAAADAPVAEPPVAEPPPSPQEQAREIVARLESAQPDQYTELLESLGRLPVDETVAPAIAAIVSRPAAEIGGAHTVRAGCEVLERSGADDHATIDALLFAMVNFSDGPYIDTFRECSLALLRIGDAAVPQLLTVFNHEHDVINAHLAQRGHTPEVGGLRAARVLADLASPVSLEGLIAWFEREHLVAVDELMAMSAEAAQAWHQNFGQQFTFATEALGYLATPTRQDRARQLLQGLARGGEGSPLDNFRRFMSTSSDAELGLRGAAIDALANVGAEADREVFWYCACRGELARIPDDYIRRHAAHALLLTYWDDLPDFEECPEDGFEANLDPYRGMLGLVFDCQKRLDCLSDGLSSDDPWVREKAAFGLAHDVEDRRGAASALLDALSTASEEDRLMFIRQLRNLPLPTDGEDRIATLIEAARGTSAGELRYQLRVLRLRMVRN